MDYFTVYIMLFVAYPDTVLDVYEIRRPDFIRQRLSSYCILDIYLFSR